MPPGAGQAKVEDDNVREWVANYAPDAASGQDLLDFSDPVNSLCRVLAAQSTRPPLSVGLFGDWGAGKSFFMKMMQARVAALADASRLAAEEGRPTLFCSEIRQVTFNAWLSSDRDPWPSLAMRVLSAVAGVDPDAIQTEAEAKSLSQFQTGLNPRYESLQRQREQAEIATKAAQQRIQDVTTNIEKARGDLLDVARQFGSGGQTVATGVESASDVIGTWREIRQIWELLNRKTRVVLATAVVGMLLAFGWFVTHPSWIRWLSAAAVWFASAIAIAAPSVRKTRKIVSAQLQVLNSQRNREALMREVEQRANESAEANRQLKDLPGVTLLPDYARKAASEWAERERKGLSTLALLRDQFERLNRDIMYSPPSHGGSNTGRREGPPIERLIVYIDDLDRCRPGLVVKVLEAIKLLMDLPSFIVVVGVDSRWLTRSLEVYFQDVLRSDSEQHASEDLALTPGSYLEKIFQYSLVLPRMTDKGYARLVQSLVPSPPSPTPSVTPTDPDNLEAILDPKVASEPLQVSEDLTPTALIIGTEELRFAQLLAPLIDTPRVAKRLVNIYQLLRSSLNADQIRALMGNTQSGGGYQVVLILLAIAVGESAGVSLDCFRQIAFEEPKKSWWSFIDELRPRINPEGPENRYSNSTRENMSFEEARAWARLVDNLYTLRPRVEIEYSMRAFQYWLPVVAQFSFHPWRSIAAYPSTVISPQLRMEQTVQRSESSGGVEDAARRNK
jgi:hypothetical protein